jgi:hypothetical protein
MGGRSGGAENDDAAIGRHVFLPWARKNEPKGRFDQKLPLIVWVFVGFWPKTAEIAPKPTQSSRFFGEIWVWAEIWVAALELAGADGSVCWCSRVTESGWH